MMADGQAQRRSVPDDGARRGAPGAGRWATADVVRCWRGWPSLRPARAPTTFGLSDNRD